jgi:hypothetical protein
MKAHRHGRATPARLACPKECCRVGPVMRQDWLASGRRAPGCRRLPDLAGAIDREENPMFIVMPEARSVVIFPDSALRKRCSMSDRLAIVTARPPSVDSASLARDNGSGGRSRQTRRGACRVIESIEKSANVGECPESHDGLSMREIRRRHRVI